MVEKVSYCVGCTGMGLPCKGSLCENYGDRIEVSCDSCGGSSGKIYQDGDQQLCAGCLAYKHKDAFIELFIDEIVKNYAEQFVEDYYNEVEEMGND